MLFRSKYKITPGQTYCNGYKTVTAHYAHHPEKPAKPKRRYCAQYAYYDGV